MGVLNFCPEYRKDIYNNSNKFNALIADLLPKNEKERNALSNALKANVSIYIFNHNLFTQLYFDL